MSDNQELCQALEQFLKANEEELQKPETWEGYKAITLTIMGFIPPAIPYVALASMVFDFIINAVKAKA